MNILRRFLVLLFAITASACSGGSHGALPPEKSGSRAALSAASDPYASAVLGDAPTAYYRLDDTGTTVLDSSGNGLNGTAGSSVTESAGDLLSSSADAAMAFPGSKTAAGIVSAPQNTLLQPSASVSIEAWLRFSTAPSTYTVAVAYGSDSNYAPYDLYFVSGKIAAQFYLSSGVAVVTSPTALTANTTYYVAATYDGTAARLYVNGALAGSTEKTGTLTGYTAGFGVGIGDDAALSDPAFNGTIDEVAIYAGKVLSATQVQNHYSAGTSAASPTPAPTASASSTPAPTPTPAPTVTPAPTPTGSATPTPNFGPRTGTIVAIGTNRFQMQLGSGCGYTWINTNSSTVYEPANALPKVGLVATISGIGACSTSLTGTYVVMPALIAPPAYSDWNTYGDNLASTSYNPNESTISPANVSGIHLLWADSLGAAVTDEPLVATNVPIGGSVKTVLYAGAENGILYALDAADGHTLWSQQLGTITTSCMDLPGGKNGITGTAAFDRASNRLYVADGKNNVHALDMRTGQELAGWPVNIANQVVQDHIYGAVTYNPANGLLYAETGSYCDIAPWHGRITAIDTSSASIVANFYPAAPYEGAGIWGIGGASIDGAGNVYVSTGNSVNAPLEGSAYGEHIVKLDSRLNVLSANDPSITGNDVDFGATPMLFTPPGCPLEVSAKGKSGLFYTWNAASINSGPLQGLAMMPNTSAGQFIGTTAYSPAANLVYVGDPFGNTGFTHGVIALRPQSNCSLSIAWQATLGSAISLTQDSNDTPVAANGVLYVPAGRNNKVYALDASSGTLLWNSASVISGPAMSGATIDGRLFVGAWDGKLYAFGL